MLSLLLHAFAAQGIVPPAQLHPEDALLVIEIPDVPSLVDAYANAPLVQLTGNEALRALVGEILARVSPDLARQGASALRGLGLPDVVADHPAETLQEIVRSIAHASFSVSMDREDAGRLGMQLTHWQEALGELAELQATLEEAKRTTGLPSSLATLLVEERLLTDPWGHPYVYSPDRDGSFFSLFSLGADGENGGYGAASDFAPFTSIEGMLVGELTSVFGALSILQFDSKERAVQVTGLVHGLAEQTIGRLRERIELQVGEDVGELCFIDLSYASELPLWTLQAGPWFALGVGRVGGSPVAEQLSNSDAPSALEFVERHLAWLPASEGATVLQACFRPRPVLELLRDVSAVTAGGERAFLDAAVASIGEGGAIRTELVGDRFRTYTVSREPSEMPDMARCIGRTPLEALDLAVIPEDAVGIIATTWDPSLTSSVLLEALQHARDSTGRSAAQRLTELEQRYGFNLATDIFGGFGNSVIGYLPPLRGILSVPGIALAIELRDPTAFRRGLEGILSLLTQISDGAVSVNDREYRGTPMWTLSMGSGGGLAGMSLQLSPTLSIVGDHLLVTLSSTWAKKEIKRLLQSAGSSPEGVHGAYRPPPGAVSFSYFDWPNLIGGVYSGAVGLLTLLGDRLPFDAALLPSAEVWTESFRPTFSWTRVADGTVESYHESSFGPETLVGALGLGLGAAWFQSAPRSWSSEELEEARVHR